MIKWCTAECKETHWNTLYDILSISIDSIQGKNIWSHGWSEPIHCFSLSFRPANFVPKFSQGRGASGAIRFSLTRVVVTCLNSNPHPPTTSTNESFRKVINSLYNPPHPTHPTILHSFTIPCFHAKPTTPAVYRLTLKLVKFLEQLFSHSPQPFCYHTLTEKFVSYFYESLSNYVHHLGFCYLIKALHLSDLHFFSFWLIMRRNGWKHVEKLWFLKMSGCTSAIGWVLGIHNFENTS